MQLLVVEDRAFVLSLAHRHAMNHLWLILEPVSDKDIVGKVLWQVSCEGDLQTEKNLPVKELVRVSDKQVLIRLSFPSAVARDVSYLQFAYF